MEKIEICRLEDTISVIKNHGTAVNYYLFHEYEIHFNKMPPHTIQDWHCHQHIEEVIMVTKGNLNCLYLENQKIRTVKIHEKELLRVKKSIHTLSNDDDQECEFIVFRLILTHKNKRKFFVEDKIEVLIEKLI